MLDIACVCNLGELAVRNNVDANFLLALDFDVDSVAYDGIEELIRDGRTLFGSQHDIRNHLASR